MGWERMEGKVPGTGAGADPTGNQAGSDSWHSKMLQKEEE